MNDRSSPSVDIVLQYVKDLSLENPAPEKFLMASADEVQTNVQVDVRTEELGESEYESIIYLKVDVSSANKTCYVLEIQYAGRFRIIHHNDQDMLSIFLFVQGPHLLFPYLRSIVTLLTQESGFPALNLQPVDFLSIFQKKNTQPSILRS